MRRFYLAALAVALLTGDLLGQNGDSNGGSRIFATNCSGCHGSDGRGGERAPNIATARNVASLSDSELANFVRNGVPGSGMPAFGFLGDEGVGNVVAFLRQLQGKSPTAKVSGDDAAGRSLFFGSAGCSECHTMHGQGGFIASDLSDYGNGIAFDRIRAAIIEPETFVTPGSEVVEVVTATGENLLGVLRAENNFTVVLQLQNGRYRRLTKASLKKFTHTRHSLMPADYKSRLSPKEVDDIVSYLVRSASPMEPASHKRKRADQ